MASNDPATVNRSISDKEASAAVRVGLEPLGSDVLVEGEIRELSTRGMVVATPSLLAIGTRAFVVIDDPSGPPVVGLIEIDDQTVLIEDVIVESHARFVRLTADNARRLTALCTTTSGVGFDPKDAAPPSP